MKTIIAVLSIFCSYMAAHAQDGDWTVELRFNRKASKVQLQRLANDSLFVRQDDVSEGIHLDVIVGMRKERATYGWAGAAIGTGAGGVLGVIAGPDVVGGYPSLGRLAGGVLGGLAGGAIGTLIGLGIKSEDEYDMEGMTRDQKRASIDYILLHDY